MPANRDDSDSEPVGVVGDERPDPRATAEIDRTTDETVRKRRLRALGHPKESTTPDLQAFRSRSCAAEPTRTGVLGLPSPRAFLRGGFALHFDESGNFSAPAAFGTYRVLHQTGSGVLGPVFRAFDSPRDRLVAIKVFRLDLLPEQVVRLADALRRLQSAPPVHPLIVPLLDVGLEGTTPYVVMSFQPGETLDIVLRRATPMPIDRALRILRPLAATLMAAGEAGILHGALASP